MFKAILVTFLVAMVPVIELRGALPLGVSMGLPPVLAMIISILGNLVPVPFVLLLIGKIFDFLREKKFSRKFISWLEKKAEKNHEKIEKYGWLGLILLVAIPLPGTGAWTGALVSGCFKMRKRKSCLAIGVGVIIAGIIVFSITYGVKALIS